MTMEKNTPTTPFAMRCTQEQFDDVKEELGKYKRIYAIVSFYGFQILILRGKSVTNVNKEFCDAEEIPIIPVWDKSLFLKMAGKPDPESRELIGYKINPEFDITAEELAVLLRCGYDEKDGLFLWTGSKYNQDHILARAERLGIVGEGKWLVPVYRETVPVKTPLEALELMKDRMYQHLQNENGSTLLIDELRDLGLTVHTEAVGGGRITGTYEQQKALPDNTKYTPVT